MNLIAIDIGNTNVKVAFFLDDTEQQIVCFSPADEGFQERLGRFLEDCWEQVPLVASVGGTDPKRRDRRQLGQSRNDRAECQICLSELGEKSRSSVRMCRCR